MGLKGKIEAIIYAAEEPISLEQIALLVKEPALQELAQERERAEAAESEAAETQQRDGAESGEPTEGVSAEASTQTISETADETVAHQETVAQQSSEVAGAPEQEVTDIAGEPVPEAQQQESPAPEPQNTAPAAVEASAAGTNDQPLPNAAETTKSNVASKRRARVEIPVEVRGKVRSILEELIADYSNADRGMEIRQVAGGYRMATKPEYHDVVKAFAKSLKPPLRLSLPALETLAVVAYKQPVTAPEVGEIRGVDSQGVMATLLDRKLVTTAGRKAVIGRPILYKTTKEFLLRFGLKDISELPSMEEFERLALEAGQVDMFRTEEEPPKPLPTEEGENAGCDAGENSAVEREPGLEGYATEASEPTAPTSEADAQADTSNPTDSISDASGDTSSAESEEPVR